MWVIGVESPFDNLMNDVLYAHEIGESRKLKLDVIWSFAPAAVSIFLIWISTHKTYRKTYKISRWFSFLSLLSNSIFADITLEWRSLLDYSVEHEKMSTLGDAAADI